MPIDDFCRFFQKMEDDPSRIIKGLTIRDFLFAREHLYNCDTCFMRSERIEAKAPKKKNKLGFDLEIGEN